MNEERRQKISRIFDLALKLNETPTEQEITGEKPTIFVRFSGHIAACNLYIHSNGYASGVSVVEQFDIPLCRDWQIDPYCTGDVKLRVSVDELVNEALKRIEEICLQWGVDIE